MADNPRHPDTPGQDRVEDLIARARQLAKTFEGAQGQGGGWSLLFPTVRFAEDRQARVHALVRACGDNPSDLLRAREHLHKESPPDDATAFKAQKLLLDAFFVAKVWERRGGE